jgi:hypothetical protein
MTFREFLMIDEGLLLPDKPRWKGMSRINPFPCTNADRRKLMPKKPPKWCVSKDLVEMGDRHRRRVPFGSKS